MDSSTTLIAQNERSFMPSSFQVEDWDGIASFYIELNDRPIETQEQFEQWLKDWDELYAVVSEDMRLKYIKTSIDTTDETAKKKLESYYIDIDPKIKPWENKLQKRFEASSFKESLSEDFRNCTKRYVQRTV